MTGLTWISAFALMVAVPSRGPDDAAAHTAVQEIRVAQEVPHAVPPAPHARTPQIHRHQKKSARLACKDVTMRADRAGRTGCDVHGESKE
jgi:hypothetical protein